MFVNLTKPKDLSQYRLFRGATDFSNLAQAHNLETGYPFLIVTKIPDFMEKLAEYDTVRANLFKNYIHVLEYEFRGIDGLENITTDTTEFSNGISSINVITKVNEQGGSEFTMRFFEKAGSIITRTHEIFLRGLKDPRSQAKRYCGLLDRGALEAGYEHETFQFLYFVTDPTVTEVERAFLIIGAQPNTAEISIYNEEKGEMGFKEVTVSFNGFPVVCDDINLMAKDILDWMNSPSNTTLSKFKMNSYERYYSAQDKINTTPTK